MIANTVTVVHISDIHLAGRRDSRSLALLENMLRRFNEKAVDHLVVTGDLCDNASPAGWSAIRDVLAATGFWSFERATVIPGNHDLINLENEIRLYNALNPFPASRLRVLQKKLDTFQEIFRELTGGEEQKPSGFPFLKILKFPAFSLAFVAVNSVWQWHRSDNPLGARGRIASSELDALGSAEVRAAVNNCVVAGLCHHALKVYGTSSPIDQAFDWTMELINHADYLATMKALGAKVLLHGHFHRFQSYVMDGVPVVNGGSFRYDPLRYSEMVFAADGTFSQRFLTLA